MQPGSRPVSDHTLREFVLGKLDGEPLKVVEDYLNSTPDAWKRLEKFQDDEFVRKVRAAGEEPVAERSGETASIKATNVDTSAVVSSPSSKASRSHRNADAPSGRADFRDDSTSGIQDIPADLVDCKEYEIVRMLDKGGMGDVYLAKHLTMGGRLEALKIMNSKQLDSPGSRERFQQEISTAAKLFHPNIVMAYNVLQLPNSICFAMEYVKGENLQAYVAKHGPQQIHQACGLVQHVVRGLQHAYSEETVHRDIKPSNLMLTKSDGKWLVKILDFGLAKAQREHASSDLTMSGDGMGTPAYTAPEQILNASKADIRADIYSLGCTLYFLLTGKPPFTGTPGEIWLAHHQQEPTPLNIKRPEIPTPLAAVVAKMLAKDPEKRYQQPAEVGDALKPFIELKSNPKRQVNRQNRSIPSSPAGDSSASPPSQISLADSKRRNQSTPAQMEGKPTTSLAKLTRTRSRTGESSKRETSFSSLIRDSRMQVGAGALACVLLIGVFWAGGLGTNTEVRAARVWGERRAKLERTLDRPMTLTVDDGTLGELLATLSQKTDLDFHVEEDELGRPVAEMEIVGKHFPEISSRSILDRYCVDLNDLGIGYHVDQDLVVITSVDKARKLETGIYTVGKLAPESGANAEDTLMDLIVSHIAPDTWDDVGGNGAMRFHDGRLVISQEQRIHRTIEKLLVALDSLDPQTTAPTSIFGAPRVQQSLKTPISVDLHSCSLYDALDRVQEEMQIDIKCDYSVLTISSNSMVNDLQLKERDAEYVLQSILSPLQLGFLVRDDHLLVTSNENIDRELDIWIFPIGDQNLTQQKLGTFIEAIINTIGPDSWDVVGGEGAIAYFDPVKSLVISQTTNVLLEVRDFLARLRDVSADAIHSRSVPQATFATKKSKTTNIELVHAPGGNFIRSQLPSIVVHNPSFSDDRGAHFLPVAGVTW
ncbi:MAG: serine/threonine protein kinase [Planctomycetales bacterium]|nr:serine/threonine protein kinase [Planctomycetales bacterium]